MVTDPASLGGSFTSRVRSMNRAKLLILGLCVGAISFGGFRLVGVGGPSEVLQNSAVGPQPYHVAVIDDGAVIRREIGQPAVDNEGYDPEAHTVPRLREVDHKIGRGETISQVFSVYGVSAVEAEQWIRAARKVYDLNRVYEGQHVTLQVDAGSGRLTGLRMEIDPQTTLVGSHDEEQGVVVARETADLDRSLRVVKGGITSSFYAAAADADVPDPVISKVADILGWDINFATDVRPGAEFKILYEQLERADGGKKISGRVLAVQLQGRRRTHEGILHKNGEGKEVYYSRTGESLGRDFLRYPVSFTRISSHFSTARFHPVLKRRKPHYGVDFAAPTGTPVRSVADGRVEVSGWHGGNGRFVKVRHDKTYQSSYSHLSRIAGGIAEGTSVRKGQIVGYVGASGLATGPHLHFAMYKHGDYINPLSASMPRSKSLAGDELHAFLRRVVRIDDAYAKASTTGSSIVVASADVLH